MEEVSEILRCQSMEGFVSDEEGFVDDSGFDGEPVKVDEGGGDVLPGFGAGENPGS